MPASYVVCVRDEGWEEEEWGGLRVRYLPHQPHDLPSSARLEVEIVDCGDAADFVVGGAWGAEFLRAGHLE